jgi:hypothetical protein
MHRDGREISRNILRWPRVPLDLPNRITMTDGTKQEGIRSFAYGFELNESIAARQKPRLPLNNPDELHKFCSAADLATTQICSDM